MKERGGARGGAGEGQPKRVLPLLTDLIFVSIAVYQLLGNARLLLISSVTPVFLLREIFLILYLLTALVLLGLRNSAKVFSGKKADYAYTILGFSSPLFFQATPNESPFFVGATFEFIGLAFVVGAFLSLNRSFGLAPENRGVKTRGVYRSVRHPMYLGYILAEVGYVCNNISYLNIFILAISLLFLLLRLRAEEQLLQRDQDYREYAEKTRWRLLPGVY